MQKLFIVLIAQLFITATPFAQKHYEETPDKSGGKIFKGFLTKDVLMQDSTFTWYKANLVGFIPNTKAVEALKLHKDSINLLVFMGIWCDDSKLIIPRFYALLDSAGFSESRVTLIGLDRQKKFYNNITDALNITNVPTIIVMKNGKETGRVVEYGTTGYFDKDLGNILTGNK